MHHLTTLLRPGVASYISRLRSRALWTEVPAEATLACPPLGGEELDLHPKINPDADAETGGRDHDAPMTTTDYLIDSTLVLLVLLQIKERTLTTKALIRPLIIVGIAVANYLHGIPTSGNDLVLVAVLALLGGAIGLASAKTVIMRAGSDGNVLARAGWASAFFWVLGMGSRFAFIFWITHSGVSALGQFSVQHSITASAWTVALLAMAVCEVVSRSALMAVRRQHLQGRLALQIA
jgi:hypothetical protein